MTEHRSSRLLLVLVTLLWGMNFIAARWSLDAMTVWGFRSVTFSAGTLALLVLAALTRVPLRLRRAMDYLHLAVAGFFSIALFGALLAYSLLHTPVGRTSIITYTMPVWVALLGVIVLGEKLGTPRIIALFLSVIGLTVLGYPMFAHGITLGNASALLGAVAWSIGTVYLKWARVQADPLTITLWQLVLGTIPIIWVFVLSGEPIFLTAPTATTWIGLIYAAFFGTSLAYVLWFKVVQELPASVAGLGMLFVPVAAMILGVALLGERPSLIDAIAFGMIFVAGFLAIRGGRRRAG